MELNTKHIKSSLSGCPLYLNILSLCTSYRPYFSTVTYFTIAIHLGWVSWTCVWTITSKELLLVVEFCSAQSYVQDGNILLQPRMTIGFVSTLSISEWSEDINNESRLCPNQLISSLITWWPETCSIDLCAVLLNHSITSLSLCTIFDWRTQNRSQLLVIQFVVDIHLQTQRWSRQKHLNTFLKALESIFSSLLDRDLIKSPWS